MIDDIDYLKEQSEKDSIVIFVDSSKRDYNIYSTPSEYGLTFEQPFRNVYSVEILDATIPTVMYNVDKPKSSMYLSIVKRSTKNIQPNSVYLVSELFMCSVFTILFDADYESTVLVVDFSQITIYFDIADPANDYIPSSSNIVAMRRVIENTSIVEYVNQTSEEFHIFTYSDKTYCIKSIEANKQIISIIEDNNYCVVLNSLGKYDLVYFNFKTVSSHAFQSMKTDNVYSLMILNCRSTVTVGNYTALSLREYLTSHWLSYNIVVSQVGNTDDTFQGRYKFTCTDLIIFNCVKRSLDTVLGFDLYPQKADQDIYYKGVTVGKNVQVFMSIYNASSQFYEIIPPGLMNLRGERYIILRCPELEDHLYGSYSYNSFTPGIGMFKIESYTTSSTSLRWDYTTLVRKPIHPIGKLSKLTFRFVMSSGDLYDFKGLNHQFMLAIKYYIPTKKIKFTRSVLNPNYNPNFIDYMSTNKNIQNREGSDNEDEGDIDEEQAYNAYKKQISVYQKKIEESDDYDTP